MKLEVERKFPVDDLEAFAARLASDEIELGAPTRQVDAYFGHPSRDFGQTDEALRTRSVGAVNYITYKGPKLDAITKTRQEIELPLGEGTEVATRFGELLLALGFRRVGTVAKSRRVAKIPWEGEEVEIALDQVDGLGNFVELEVGADEAGLDRARDRLASLAAHLSLNRDERRGYLQIQLANAQAGSDVSSAPPRPTR